jgi:hypothetical protein
LIGIAILGGLSVWDHFVFRELFGKLLPGSDFWLRPVFTVLNQTVLNPDTVANSDTTANPHTDGYWLFLG